MKGRLKAPLKGGLWVPVGLIQGRSRADMIILRLGWIPGALGGTLSTGPCWFRGALQGRIRHRGVEEGHVTYGFYYKIERFDFLARGHSQSPLNHWFARLIKGLETGTPELGAP